MSLLWSLPRTYHQIRRLRDIALTLAKHGFSHLVARLPLADSFPGLGRLRFSLTPESNARSAPERMCRVFEDLGPTFIKFGQLLATRPDLLPLEFLTAFRRLQDQVDPVPVSQIQGILTKRLGAPVEKIFASFDETPLASGSIGQVHCARLKDGTDVIVKVKRPGTDTMVELDLAILRDLAALIEDHIPELRIMRPRVLVDEFARSMERELDFVGEAAYTAQFAVEYQDDETINVPKVYWDYATHDTLVLERIRGIRLTDSAALEATAIRKSELADTLGRIFLRQFFIRGLFHADPHPGNIFVRNNGDIVLIDFGQVGRISDDLRRKLAMTVFALNSGNVDLIVDVYADIGVFTEATDLREFKAELAAVIDRYYGVPANRMDMGQVLQEALSVARRNGILMPRDFVMLSKSFVTILGVIQQLHPQFQFNEAVSPFVKDLGKSLADPAQLAQGMGFYAYRVYGLLRRLPEDLRDLMEKLRGGRMRVVMHHEGLTETGTRIEHAVNRLTLGLIMSAIIVGSAIVLNITKAEITVRLPYLGKLPLAILLSGTGFTLAMFLGFGLAWSIFRSKRY